MVKLVTMKAWIIVISVATFCAVSNAASPKEVVKNITEEWRDDKGHLGDIGRIIHLSHDEMTGRTFKILTQALETKNPKSITRRMKVISVDYETGEIHLLKKLDREKLCRKAQECFIKIKVITFHKNTNDLLRFRFNIVDTNDNQPQFRRNKFDIILGEDEYSKGDTIVMDDLRASDADIGENGRIVYSLEKNPYLAIAEEDRDGSNVLRLRVLKTLDHESVSRLNFTLYANDRGVPALSSRVTLNITITDANDNVPVFAQKEYNVTVPENQAQSTRLVTVHATDADSGKYGEVRYFVEPMSLKSCNGLISIHEISGEVMLEKTLNKAEHDNLRIAIEARDSDPKRQLIGKAWIVLSVVDVNDHSPDVEVSFIKYSKNNTGYVNESYQVNEFVAFISATDEDEGRNGKVEIEISTFGKRHSSPDYIEVSEVFTFQNDGRLLTGRSLDREVYQEYLIKIRACDNGVRSRCTDTNIKIIILDVNDNRPVFVGRRDTIVVREDTKVGAVIGKVQAEDGDAAYPPVFSLKNDIIQESRNGIITYSISKEHQQYFEIGHTSGRITLKKKLDYENQRQFDVRVTAEDGGVPARNRIMTVHIQVHDVNDNRPVFVNPSKNETWVDATILKDQPIMVVKAIDQDIGKNSKIRYSIVKHSGLPKTDQKRREGLFIINPTSGTLRLNFSKGNLSTFLGSHSIVVMARDSADSPLSASVVLHVRVTDHDILYPAAASAFNSKFTIIVVVLSVASLLLIVMIVIILVRRRRRRRPHTYDCKMGKEVRRSWISLPKCSDRRSGEERNTLGMNVRNRREECESPSAMIDVHQEVKTNNTTSLSLPVVRSVDMDSGKGESGSENDDFTQSDMGASSQLQLRPLSKSANRASSHSDVASSRISELGPRCDESCRQLGHSDSCWLPSPQSDVYGPGSISSHQPIYNSTPTSQSQHQYQQNCTNSEDGQFSAPSICVQDDRYRISSSEYFQTLPSNSTRMAEIQHSGYDMELETIAEGIPLGMPSVTECGNSYEMDDVCNMTNIRLSTSMDPSAIASNTGAATIRRMGKHVPEMNSVHNWNKTKYHSVSYLPGPTHAFSYNDISYVPPSHGFHVHAGINHMDYQYLSLSPLAVDQRGNHVDRHVSSDRPIPFRQPPEGGYRGGYPDANYDQTVVDTRTALLNESSCNSDFTCSGDGTRNLYL